MAHSRELLLMIGESGSGKSTLARQLVADKGYVRVNRDDLRVELAPLAHTFKGGLGGRAFEDHVAKTERARAADALAANKNVVVDNTHLNPATVDKWRQFCNHKAAFDIYRLTTPLAECIARDSQRSGSARVGRPVIERQFLISGRLPLDRSKPVILVDMDGTVATHYGADGRALRSPYAQNVEVDGVWEPIKQLVNDLHAQGNTVLMVSGRKSTCGDTSCEWLTAKDIHYDHVFMRHAWDNRKDSLVKEEILNELLKLIPVDQIKLVLDDRPQVVKMWQSKGLPVQPVYAGQLLSDSEFTTEHAPGCAWATQQGYGRCPACGALEDF